MSYYLGIDLGGTRTKAGIVDDQGRILNKDSIRTDVDRTPQAIFQDIADMVARVIDASGVPATEIRAIGLGSPGTSSNQAGAIIFAGNLPSLNGWPFRAEFHKCFNLPFYIGNDANCAALAEASTGAARGCHSSVTVTLGTGVGGGIVINDRIYAGFNDAGSELGHTVIVAGGEPCTCGRRGCFEAYASATALVRETVRAAAAHPESLLNRLIADNGGKADGRIAFNGMKAGDPAATAVVENYINMLAEGLANIINFIMPETIVIGGGVSNEGEALFGPARARALDLAFLPEGIEQPRIVPAQAGNDAGIIGAALMAMRCLEDGLVG